jgi:hypothetical protein
MAESLLFIAIIDRLTETTRYWGHEHDYHNNMISVPLGGVVPRDVPCNKKEAENLREGPFSNFRPTSNASPEKGTSGETQLKDGKKNALPETNAAALEQQNTQAKQASVTADPRVDEPPVTGTDEEDEEENEVNDTHPETDRNPGEAEEEIEPTLETDDTAHRSRWKSQILCVIDPFIPQKVMLVVIYYACLTDTTF